MERKQQYFIWNNSHTFERGIGDNIQITEQGFTIGQAGSAGVYYTRICDSRREKMQWDRLLLEGEVHYQDAMKISVYTCETDRISYRGQTYRLQDFLKDISVTIEEKNRVFRNYKRMEFTYGKDQLLHGVTGRFLWLRFQLNQTGEVPVKIHQIQVLFPRLSWCVYLPELYRNTENSFLERYLEIFQSMYQEMDQRIAALPELYSPNRTPSQYLIWLSQWISVENPYLWQEEQLRYLIQHGIALSELRGTVNYLKQMLQLYTDTVPYIVEYWQWAYEEMDGSRRKMLENLYGENSYCVTIILGEQAVSDWRRLSVLERLAEDCSPAHIETRIEILQSFIFLDRHSYLGINSQLGVMGEPVLDGQNFLPFIVLKEKENRNEG